MTEAEMTCKPVKKPILKQSPLGSGANRRKNSASSRRDLSFLTSVVTCHHYLHSSKYKVYYLTETAACQRACRSDLSPVCWAGHYTVPGAHPSRSCSGIVFWHKVHLEPSRGPRPSLGGSAASQCSSSAHCPRGRGIGPGPGCWRRRCVHGRSCSLQG